MKLTLKETLVCTAITVVIVVLLIGVSGCRAVDGLVWDTYHIAGALGDGTSKRCERVERKDIIAEQDRLGKQYRRFIMTSPDGTVEDVK